jgi:hypothetical protein
VCHHLTPSGILHIAAFVTLCEAYMGIEPHFDLRNYFFHAQIRLGSDTEVVVWSSVDIFVRFGSGIYPYFCFSMSQPLVGWQKVWFSLGNDADALLPVFTGCHPIPQPKCGYSVAYQHIWKLQPLCVIVRQLLRGGMMGADLLRTFVSCRIQPLRRRVMTMWVYPGPSCPDHSFFTKLDDAKINTGIRGIVVNGADQNSSPSPTL